MHDLQNQASVIASLKRQLRFMRWAIMLGSVALGGTLAAQLIRPASSQSTKQVTVADDGIYLKNAAGKVLSSWTVYHTGQAGLSFYDENEKERVNVSVLGESGYIGLYDAEGRKRLSASVESDGSTSLVLVDQNKKIRAAVTVTGETPELVLSDENGTERLRASVFSSNARIEISGPDGKKLWAAP